MQGTPLLYTGNASGSNKKNMPCLTLIYLKEATNVS